MSVTIPQYTLENGVTVYQINTRLPLRSINAPRRYSEFLALRDALCAETGISRGDFPYALPPKAGVFSSKEKVALERKAKLAQFLDLLIRHREFQNSPLVHRFLNVPPNFEFTTDLFSTGEETQDGKFSIPESALDIGKAQWLNYCRHLRSTVNALRTGSQLADRVANRENILRYIQPNLEKLAVALGNLQDRNELSADELRSRKSLLTGLQEKLEATLDPDRSKNLSNEDSNGHTVNFSSRVFARPKTYEETKDTIDASNTELLQRQQQIHANQDQEIEELRKIIARQRQIGEAINAEVQEQNEMLSSFTEEVERSGEKVSKARGRVRKLG